MAAQVELVKTGELVEEGKVLVVLMVRTKLHLRDVEDLAPRGTSQGQTLGLEPWQSQMWEMRVWEWSEAARWWKSFRSGKSFSIQQRRELKTEAWEL